MELNEENEKQKSSFLLKLRTILNEPENEEYIKWSKDGKFFIINCENLNAFADNILPQYFKHRNFNSFHRQLNLYNFRTIPNDNQDEIHFIHDKFKKGITDEEIKTIKKNKKIKKIKKNNKKLNSVQVEENEYENIDNLDEDTKIQKIKENIQKLNNPHKMIFNFLIEKLKNQEYLIEKFKNEDYLFNELSVNNTNYEGQNEIINNNNLFQQNNQGKDSGPNFNNQNGMNDPKYRIYILNGGTNISTGNKNNNI